MQGPTNPKSGYPTESTKMCIIHSVTHMLLLSLQKAGFPGHPEFLAMSDQKSTH